MNSQSPLPPALHDCFYDTQSFMDQMTREHYDDAFRSYQEQCAPLIHAIDYALQTGTLSSPAIPAARLIDQIAEDWKTERAQNPKLKKHQPETRDRMFLALYLIPMLLETNAANAMPLAEAIRDEWCRRYPKTPIVVGRYSDISAGFRKKAWGMCFITTAVCEFDKKPDDCPELTALRRFRDQYMMQTPDGQALVHQYYKIAPKLVTAIDFCSDRKAVYTDLRDRYITPCLSLLASGRFSACQEHYCAMVHYLREMFSM